MSNPLRDRRVIRGGSPYPNIAAQFKVASAQFASINDNAALSGGAGLDMSWIAWVYPDALGTSRNILSKYASVGTREYLLWYQNTVGFRLNVSNDGSAVSQVIATNFGVPPLATWSFVAATYNGTTLSISVNAGTPNTAAYSSDIFDGAGRFTLGSTDGGVSNWDGRQDAVGIFCSPRGSGGALSTADIALLYKAGVGSAYRDLPSSLQRWAVAWFDLDGNLNDATINGSHLTNNNGITFVAGKR